MDDGGEGSWEKIRKSRGQSGGKKGPIENTWDRPIPLERSTRKS